MRPIITGLLNALCTLGMVILADVPASAQNSNVQPMPKAVPLAPQETLPPAERDALQRPAKPAMPLIQPPNGGLPKAQAPGGAALPLPVGAAGSPPLVDPPENSPRLKVQK